MLKGTPKKENQKAPTSGDVKDGQFFICQRGSLCYKTSYVDYTLLADSEGKPYPKTFVNHDDDTTIREVKPELEKIELGIEEDKN